MKTIAKLMTVLVAVLALSVAQSMAAPKAGGGGWGNLPAEVTGEMISNQNVFQPGAAPTISWLISRPIGKTNNGHGNNVDGVDSSNPGLGGGGPNGGVDESLGIDDEIKGGDPNTNVALADNIIRQIDLDSGVVTDIPSSLDVGSVVGMPITGPLGAIFELWADINGVLTLVDVRGIGPYMPSSSFTVNTPDPWQGFAWDSVTDTPILRNIYRVRADVKFGVEVITDGLSADPLLPLAARAVSLEVTGQDGDPLTYILAGEFPISTTSINAGSGNYTWSSWSDLNAPTQNEELGQQHFTVHTYADAVTPSWTVGRATVIVWPTAKASFYQVRNASGSIDPWDADQTFYNGVRDILVTYNDLYPESNTYVQLYKGQWVAGTKGIPITVTGLNLGGRGYEVPQNTQPQGIKIRNRDIAPVINLYGNGEYTLEVVTGNMPWLSDYYGNNNGILTDDPILYQPVAHINFKIDRKTSIRGTIGSK